MPSFSRHRFAVTSFSQVFERLPGAGSASDAEADDVSTVADEPLPPPGGHGLVEDVDFDTAIAEVLMILAADRSAVEDASPTAANGALTAAASRSPLEHETRFDDAGDSDDEHEDGEGAELNPEALLAAEAATFRLLGELDRLWHRSA